MQNKTTCKKKKKKNLCYLCSEKYCKDQQFKKNIRERKLKIPPFEKFNSENWDETTKIWFSLILPFDED